MLSRQKVVSNFFITITVRIMQFIESISYLIFSLFSASLFYVFTLLHSLSCHVSWIVKRLTLVHVRKESQLFAFKTYIFLFLFCSVATITSATATSPHHYNWTKCFNKISDMVLLAVCIFQNEEEYLIGIKARTAFSFLSTP